MKYINLLVKYAADSNLQGCIREDVIGVSSTTLHVTNLQSSVPKG